MFYRRNMLGARASCPDWARSARQRGGHERPPL